MSARKYVKANYIKSRIVSSLQKAKCLEKNKFVKKGRVDFFWVAKKYSLKNFACSVGLQRF